jgi:hypothetical protein
MSDNSVIPIGYFVQVVGIFRYVDIATLQSLDSPPNLFAFVNLPGGRFPKRSANRSLSIRRKPAIKISRARSLSKP